MATLVPHTDQLESRRFWRLDRFGGCLPLPAVCSRKNFNGAGGSRTSDTGEGCITKCQPISAGPDVHWRSEDCRLALIVVLWRLGDGLARNDKTPAPREGTPALNLIRGDAAGELLAAARDARAEQPETQEHQRRRLRDIARRAAIRAAVGSPRLLARVGRCCQRGVMAPTGPSERVVVAAVFVFQRPRDSTYLDRHSPR